MKNNQLRNHKMNYKSNNRKAMTMKIFLTVLISAFFSLNAFSTEFFQGIPGPGKIRTKALEDQKKPEEEKEVLSCSDVLVALSRLEASSIHTSRSPEFYEFLKLKPVDDFLINDRVLPKIESIRKAIRKANGMQSDTEPSAQIENLTEYERRVAGSLFLEFGEELFADALKSFEEALRKAVDGNLIEGEDDFRSKYEAEFDRTFSHRKFFQMQFPDSKQIEFRDSELEKLKGLLKSFFYKALKVNWYWAKVVREILKEVDPERLYFSEESIASLEEGYNGIEMYQQVMKKDCSLIERFYGEFLAIKRSESKKALEYLNEKPKIDGEANHTELEGFAKNDEERQRRMQNYIHVLLANFSEEKHGEKYAPSAYVQLENQFKKLSELELETDKIYGEFVRIHAGLRDPYSRFVYGKNRVRNYMDSLIGSLSGIGIKIIWEEGKIKILETLDGGVAKKAGLQENDFILEVKESPGSDWKKPTSMLDGVSWIKGEVGTVVELKVQRGEELFEIKITRAKVIIRGISYSLEEKVRGDRAYKVAVIDVSSFSGEQFVKDVRDYVKKAENDEAEALVLDLSNNPGGRMSFVIDFLGSFIKEGKVLKTDRSAQYDHPQYTKYQLVEENPSNEFLWKKPVVVLVNDASASASEIMAGVLQVYKRAIIVGSRTFGKGSVQKVEALENSGGKAPLALLKLTSQLYFLPNGRSIEGEGILPDISFIASESNSNTEGVTVGMTWDEEPFRSTDDEIGAGSEWTPVTDSMLKALREKSKVRIEQNSSFLESAKTIEKSIIEGFEKMQGVVNVNQIFERKVSIEKQSQAKGEQQLGEALKKKKQYELEEAINIAVDAIDVVK